jgi:hypothetical protein
MRRHERLVGECRRCSQPLVERDDEHGFRGIVHLDVGLCSDTSARCSWDVGLCSDTSARCSWDLCVWCFAVVAEAIEVTCEQVDLSSIPVAEASEIEALRARHTKG